jgi:hypothetical protein
MKIYVLQADYDYEGFGHAQVAWAHHPTEQEIFDFLAPSYMSESPSYGYITIEETNAQQTARLWKSIREGRWAIEECNLIS